MWKQFVKDYFTFTRKERQGVLIIIALVLIISVAPWFFPLFLPEPVTDHSDFAKEVREFQALSIGANTSGEDELLHDYSSGDGPSATPVKLRPFDPNTASEEEWIQLGVRPKTARTIQNYVSKGGRFRKPEDIRKIWSLSKNEADRLIPFVKIKPTEKSGLPTYENSYSPREERIPSETKPSFSRSKEYVYIDINNADTSAFKKFPGIGSKLAERIINYRTKLGGFYSVHQVGETYLLPDTTFQKILPFLQVDNVALKSININTISLDDLRAHPYIRFAVANAIVQYRGQHGNFSAPKDLKKIMIISDSLFLKIEPYITIE